MTANAAYTLFVDTTCIAHGPLGDVQRRAMEWMAARPEARVWVFDDAAGRRIDLDLPRPVETAGQFDGAELPDAAEPVLRGPGRPKLGVVGREVTLLPRHWDWLSSQPGGASVALRKLVDAARRDGAAADRARRAREAAYAFMSEMAGDYAGFEEAARALFASDKEKFARATASWPADVRDHAAALATAAFGG